MSHDFCCTSVNGQDHQSTQAMFHIHPKLLIGILARQEVPGSHRGALAFELKYYGILKHGLTWVKTYSLHQFYRMRDDNLQHYICCNFDYCKYPQLILIPKVGSVNDLDLEIGPNPAILKTDAGGDGAPFSQLFDLFDLFWSIYLMLSPMSPYNRGTFFWIEIWYFFWLGGSPPSSRTTSPKAECFSAPDESNR